MATRIIITRIVDDDALGEQIETAMRNLGSNVARRMQRLVPKRTWALHDTISVGTERNGARVKTQVGAGGGDVDYELMVERGTSKMRAQPFMRPALAQTRNGDLKSNAGDPKRHGVVEILSKRERRSRQAENRRANARQRKSDAAENASES